MTYPFHPAAEAEHLDQVAYYESQLPGLGARYFAAVDGLLKRASQAPQQFECFPNSQLRRAALAQFKERAPANSAVEMANAMGIERLTEPQYRELRALGEFDTRTSSWIQTPPGSQGYCVRPLASCTDENQS